MRYWTFNLYFHFLIKIVGILVLFWNISYNINSYPFTTFRRTELFPKNVRCIAGTSSISYANIIDLYTMTKNYKKYFHNNVKGKINHSNLVSKKFNFCSHHSTILSLYSPPENYGFSIFLYYYFPSHPSSFHQSLPSSPTHSPSRDQHLPGSVLKRIPCVHSLVWNSQRSCNPRMVYGLTCNCVEIVHATTAII